jgi:hypothetical protein
MPLSRTALAPCVAASALLLACSSTHVVRVAAPEPSPGIPSIDRLVDLGGLPLPAIGEVPLDHSDARITPGEWVAVLGDSLANNPLVTIDGTPVRVAGYLKGSSLFIRMPRGLSPRATHKLSVRTPWGSAEKDLLITSHIVAGATDGKTVHLIPIDSEQRSVLGKPEELDTKEAFFHALSPSGAMLYVLQALFAEETTPDGRKWVVSTVVPVHMGAASKPRKIGAFTVRTASAPTALAMSDDNTLLVLAERDLTVMDVSRPGTGWELGRVDLPSPANAPGTPVRYSDVVCLSQPSAAAALDVYSNTLVLLNLENPRLPKVDSALSLARQVDVPWSIDLAADPRDPRAVWVLQGPNIRMVGERIRKVMDSLKGRADTLFSSLTGTSLPGPLAPSAEPQPAPQAVPGPAPSPAPSSTPEHLSRIVRVRADQHALKIDEERKLPDDFYPFFVCPRRNEELLVSGVNGHVFRFGGIPLSVEGAKQAIQVLTDSMQLGRVVSVGKGGQVQPVVQGLAVYFDVDSLADGTVVYSVLRPEVSAFPPDVHAAFGVEAGDQFASLKELEWMSLIPPYALGVFEVQ